jgi:hypothetical protein
MQTNNSSALIHEARRQLDRLAELALAIKNAGLSEPAADLITRETPVDFANGVAMLAGVADNPVDRADYDRLVKQLGFTPTLNAQAMVNYDLRDAFAAAIRAA